MLVHRMTGTLPSFFCVVPGGSGVTYRWKAARNANFLVLVDGCFSVPIIIAFQPQLLRPPSHSIQPSDT